MQTLCAAQLRLVVATFAKWFEFLQPEIFHLRDLGAVVDFSSGARAEFVDDLKSKIVTAELVPICLELFATMAVVIQLKPVAVDQAGHVNSCREKDLVVEIVSD